MSDVQPGGAATPRAAHTPLTSPTTPAQSTPASPTEQPASIGQLFSAVQTHITTLIRGEIELTKLKASAFASRFGAGAGLLAAAAAVALFFLGWILHTIELALTLVLPHWAAALIVSGVLLIVVIVLAVVGLRFIQAAQPHIPTPQDGIARDVEAVKEGLGK